MSCSHLCSFYAMFIVILSLTYTSCGFWCWANNPTGHFWRCLSSSNGKQWVAFIYTMCSSLPRVHSANYPHSTIRVSCCDMCVLADNREWSANMAACGSLSLTTISRYVDLNSYILTSAFINSCEAVQYLC